jgi:tRNA nucleotidyltransferase (CCA-adding enzyme)
VDDATVQDLEASGQALLARLRELPGGSCLLGLAAGRADVELIGGATRDLLLGRSPRELDVVVDGDAERFAAELAASLPGPTDEENERSLETTVHERFGTAQVSFQGGRIDVATRRGESYPAPGALPEVRAGTPDEDLARRDFTVNAIAVALGGPRAGSVRAATHAFEDLAAERLRVLHERSFLDDPTRLLRLGRYRVRLGFEPEARTGELATEAIAGGALASVSGARVGSELRLALGEPDAVGALASLAELGALRALPPGLEFDPALARRALELLPEGGRVDLELLACLLLAAVARAGEAPLLALLGELEFLAADRDRAIGAAILAPALVERLEGLERPSQIREAVHRATLEAVALAGALGEAHGRWGVADAARRWLAELRQVRLQISGDDLLAAGIPTGPEIGQRLEAALDLRLDGKLEDSPDAQLRAALEAAV